MHVYLRVCMRSTLQNRARRAGGHGNARPEQEKTIRGKGQGAGVMPKVNCLHLLTSVGPLLLYTPLQPRTSAARTRPPYKAQHLCMGEVPKTPGPRSWCARGLHSNTQGQATSQVTGAVPDQSKSEQPRPPQHLSMRATLPLARPHGWPGSVLSIDRPTRQTRPLFLFAVNPGHPLMLRCSAVNAATPPGHRCAPAYSSTGA